MRIAFYAPLKPPDHPVPSGDRTVARAWIALLARLGHEVQVVCRLRTREVGDPDRIARLDHLGARAARLLLRRFARGRRPRPDLWFTYHPYPKAPDPLGPVVAHRLGIPLVVAEPSLSRRQAIGPLAARHRAVRDLLARARLVLVPTRRDMPALIPHLRPDTPLVHLPPFLDTAPHRAAAAHRVRHRGALARELGLDPARPWLLAVAMMRPGVKAESWRLLAAALARLEGPSWHLLAVGDGPLGGAIATELRRLGPRVRLLGARPPETLPPLYAACDLLVWPGIGEAYGMVYLEAQASGLPVVAVRSAGVPEVVDADVGNVLVAEADPAAYAAAVARLLADAGALRARGLCARRRVVAVHDLAAAARRVGPRLAALAGCGERAP